MDWSAVLELLLAVQNETAALHEAAHEGSERALTAGGVGRLRLAGAAHVVESERERWGRNDVVEPRGLRGFGIVVDGILVAYGARE